VNIITSKIFGNAVSTAKSVLRRSHCKYIHEC